MLNAILKPLLLKEDITWQDFAYPPLYAWLLLLALGILTGLDPQLQADTAMPLWANLLLMVISMLVLYPISAWFMRWWMGRKGCDGQGRMFRLIVAVSAIGLPSALLVVLGVPALFTLPLWLYSIWVAAHALEQVCKVSLGYAVGGILLSIIPALAGMIVISMIFGIIADATGLVAMPEPPTAP